MYAECRGLNPTFCIHDPILLVGLENMGSRGLVDQELFELAVEIVSAAFK